MSFKVHNEAAKAIFGASPQLDLIHEKHEYPFAHEAGVFIPEENALFITSNQFDDAETGQRKIQISKVRLSGEGQALGCEEINAPDVPMANGGVNYKGGVLFCSQGSLKAPGGLVFMESTPPHRCSNMLSSFHGREFNSVNDVVVHSDGSIWFTDPIYGFEQGIRPNPKLPSQVYRYAFDVATYSGQPFLINRRLFAMADTGIPDGIKCDTSGNVFSGCGDGVNIWSSGGVLIGKILIEGGVANFCFGAKGQLFMLNEFKIWRAQLGDGVKGALLNI
ncbi:hypothetical protein FDECE_6067 [Fusarium decemcellulare]|nr:hypothetical protein FDECE_6067 [Fusarium decemcellulare]